MKNYFDKNHKNIDFKNLSKNDIIQKFNNIKSAKSQFNKKNLFKRNKERKDLLTPKKNLTCLNFYNNNNKIFEQKYKNSEKKFRHEILFDSDYSSFLSKKSKCFNSDIHLTGLYSPNYIQTETRYMKLFSGKSNNLSRNRTKSSSTKKSKSNILNFESSFKKNDLLLLSAKKSKSNIFYNKYLYNSLLKNTFSKDRRENILDFMEKTRIIRRGKIINFELENKVITENNINKELLNLANNNKNEIYKNYSLLIKYDQSYNNYLKNLEIEKKKGILFDNELSKKKLDLEIEIFNIQLKINKLKAEITKYKNAKKFFLLVKYGSEALNNKDKKKDYSLASLEKNDNKKTQFIAKRKFSISVTQLNTNKDNINKKKYLKRYSTIVKFPFNKTNNKKQKEKTKTTIIKKSKSILNDNEDNLLNDFDFTHIITNLENILLNNLNYLTSQKKQIDKLKKDLNQIENYKDDSKNIIESKIKMLDFLKKENNRLNNKLDMIIKNNLTKESLNNILEKKLLHILININRKINIQEKISIKDLFKFLKMESTEFLNKIHISKILYMIKVIELVLLFLNDLTNRYLSDQRLEELYKEISNKFEKEKNKLMCELTKKQIKQNLEEKKINILKKAEKFRFYSTKKFYYTNNNKIKSHSKKNIKRNNSNDSRELWLSYN